MLRSERGVVRLFGSSAVIVVAGLAAAAGHAAPVITEVSWAGSDTSASDEWIEIYNPGTEAICDLSAFEIVQGTTERVLPAVGLPAQGVLVLERQPTSTALDAPAAAAFSLGSGLTNGGQVLKLCPRGVPADPACDVANPTGALWFRGTNTAPKKTMERIDATQPGDVAASWQDGAPASPGVVANAAAPGDLSACVVVAEGEGEGEGAPLPPATYAGLAVTEVYFNPSGTSEVGKEWVELANLSTESVPLAQATLERLDGATVVGTFALRGGDLAPGGRIVVARQADLDVGICLSNAPILFDTFSLPNTGTQTLRIRGTTSSGAAYSNDVKYAGAGVPASTTFDGKAMALLADDRDNTQAASFGPATCEYAAGARGTPGLPNAFDPACATPTFDVCVPVVAEGEGEGVAGEGEGEGEGAGVPLPPNTPPTVLLAAPTGAQLAAPDGGFDVSYSAADADAGDAVSVDIYLSLSTSGNAGLRVARGLQGGVDIVGHVATTGVPAGTYSVFAAVRDTRGATAYAYAPGTIAIGGGGAIEAAFRLIDPDGVNDVDGDGNVPISWEVTLPEGRVGSVALFYDTDDDGQGGTPIAGGISAAADGPRLVVWNLRDVPAGTWHVYGVLNHDGTPIVSVAPSTVSVAVPGCAAPGSTDQTNFVILLAGGLLAMLQRSRRQCATASSPTSTATSKR